MPKYPEVRVTWIDADSHGVPGMTIEEVQRWAVPMFTTRGLLLVDEPDRVIVASEDTEGDANSTATYRSLTLIPRMLIQRITGVRRTARAARSRTGQLSKPPGDPIPETVEPSPHTPLPASASTPECD